MSDTEKRATARTLEEQLGFRVLDGEDYCSARFHNALALDPANCWLVLNSDDDERFQEPIRYGQWPQAAETIIRQLWFRCVDLSTETARRREIHDKLHNRLSIAATGVMIGSFAVPLLLVVLRLVSQQQFDHLWHYGKYVGVAGLGAMVGEWLTSG